MKYIFYIKNLLLIIFTFNFISCSENESIIPPQENQIHDFHVEKNIVWTDAKGIALTMDIYIPETGRSGYPVLIVFHGGGWLFNDNSVLSDFSEYFSRHSEFIVCNVNYRLLGMNANTTTMNEIVEDAMGAVLWVKENIHKYKGDPSRVALTGDSAGGHLAAMVVMGGLNLSTNGFSNIPIGFKPTYLPEGKTAELVKAEKGLEVQALILSYASLDVYENCLIGFESPSNPFWGYGGVSARGIFGDSINVTDNPEYYIAVSANRLIPEQNLRQLPPQLCMVGSMDLVVNPRLVKEYVEDLKNAGHSAEYWEYAGKNHAYLQNGTNEFLGTSFENDAPYAIDKMIQFLNSFFK